MNPILEKIERLAAGRARMMSEGMDVSDINRRIKRLEAEYGRYLSEDTSATGGPAGAVTGSSVGSSGVAMANASIAGMGAVVSPQASSLAGSTMGPSFTGHGGKAGSGDVSFPFPVGGRNPMYQKAEMGKGHGPMTGKKSRKKRLGMKQLRDILSKKQDYTAGSERKLPKVMNWQDFHKSEMSKVKKVKY
jgi:hypothetical protein